MQATSEEIEAAKRRAFEKLQKEMDAKSIKPKKWHHATQERLLMRLYAKKVRRYIKAHKREPTENEAKALFDASLTVTLGHYISDNTRQEFLEYLEGK